MIDDKTTFFLAFIAFFAGLALYMLRIERQARRLEARLDVLEARAAKPMSQGTEPEA